MKKKLISIVTPCYNEDANIDELCQRIAAVMAALPYDYEHICIDNCSTDLTVSKIKAKAAIDKRIKLIVNTRNFGHIRSPYHGVLQSKGDACVLITSDLQDPPEMIIELINKWEQGYKTVLAVKLESEESSIMYGLRKVYYRLIAQISEVPLVKMQQELASLIGLLLIYYAIFMILIPILEGCFVKLVFPLQPFRLNNQEGSAGLQKIIFILYTTLP